jgi:hypothetical protein
MYKFSVTANSGDVYLYKMAFDVSSSTFTATTSKFGLYAYTDSAFSLPDTTFSSDGLINGASCYNGGNISSSTAALTTGVGDGMYSYVLGGIVKIWPDKGATGNGCNTATTTYKVASGSTRYFKLTASVYQVISSTVATENVTVALRGDAAFPTALCAAGSACNSNMGQAANITANDSNTDFIWSPNSTTSTVTLSDLDYTNGYGLPGLPTLNTAQEVIQNK